MTIITACPYCDEPLFYDYESGDEPIGVYEKIDCEQCSKCYFVQRLSFGETMSEEEFWAKFPKAKKVNA